MDADCVSFQKYHHPIRICVDCFSSSFGCKALYVRVVRHKGSQLSLIDLPGVTHNADQMRNIHEAQSLAFGVFIEVCYNGNGCLSSN